MGEEEEEKEEEEEGPNLTSQCMGSRGRRAEYRAHSCVCVRYIIVRIRLLWILPHKLIKQNCMPSGIIRCNSWQLLQAGAKAGAYSCVHKA